MKKMSLVTMMSLLMAGCASGDRTRTVAVVAPQGGMQAQSLSGGEDTAKPVEYINMGGVVVEGASLYPTADGMLLKGRIRSSSQAGLAASRVIRIEALSASGAIVWSGIAKIDAKPVIHRSRMKHRGTFEAQVPELSSFERFRIGAVSRSNQDAAL